MILLWPSLHVTYILSGIFFVIIVYSDPVVIYEYMQTRLRKWLTAVLVDSAGCVVCFQLVCRGMGGVQPELWRRGAYATGPVCPENQPDQCRHPGWLSLCSAHPSQEAGLQHTQLSTSLDLWALVTGRHVSYLTLVRITRQYPKQNYTKLQTRNSAWRTLPFMTMISIALKSQCALWDLSVLCPLSNSFTLCVVSHFFNSLYSKYPKLLATNGVQSTSAQTLCGTTMSHSACSFPLQAHAPWIGPPLLNFD